MVKRSPIYVYIYSHKMYYAANLRSTFLKSRVCLFQPPECLLHLHIVRTKHVIHQRSWTNRAFTVFCASMLGRSRNTGDMKHENENTRRYNWSCHVDEKRMVTTGQCMFMMKKLIYILYTDDSIMIAPDINLLYKTIDNLRKHGRGHLTHTPPAFKLVRFRKEWDLFCCQCGF